MKKFLFLLSAVLLSFILISCDNFMKNFLEGSELQDELDRYITITNSEKPKLRTKSPEYRDDGVFKNTTISLTLSHKIEEKNFRFTIDELKAAGVLDASGKENSGYTILKDENLKPYAYTYRNQTYFKNISITDASDKSLCSSFNAPVIASYNSAKNETLIQIPVNELAIQDFTGLLDVNVKFSKDIEDSKGIPVTSDISWRYLAKNAFEKEKPEIIKEGTFGAISLENISEELKDASYADAYVDSFVPEEKVYDLCNDSIPPKRTVFFEGSIPAADAKDNNRNIRHFFLINHIKDSAYFVIQGSDQGSESVNALISWKRKTDEYGEKVTDDIPEDELKVKILLERKSTGTKDIICEGSYILDLSDEKYRDGLYEVEIQIEDNSLNLSENKAVYYVVRDTKVTASLDNLSISNGFPSMNTDFPADHWQDLNLTVDSNGNVTGGADKAASDAFWSYSYYDGNTFKYALTTRPTAYYFNSRRDVLNISDSGNDFFYTYNAGNTKVNIETETDRFTYTCDFGLSADDIKPENKNVPFRFNQWGDSKDQSEYILPQSLLDFYNDNQDSNIFVRINIKDEVNNTITTDLSFPAKANITNYTYNAANNKITLNIADQSNVEWSSILNLTKYNASLEYRVFYVATDTAVTSDNDSIYYKRNMKPEMEYLTGSASDGFSFEIDPSKKYSVIIRPEFLLTKKSNNNYSGYISGPITIINGISKAGSTSSTLAEPQFTAAKEQLSKKVKNSGLTTVYYTGTNIDKSLKYMAAYSINGTEYSYFDITFDANNKASFVIPTPVIAPVSSEWIEETQEFDGKGIWLDNAYGFDSYWDDEQQQLFPATENDYGHKKYSYFPQAGSTVSPKEDYSTDVYFKLIAIKGNESKESAVQTLTYVEADDNSAPYINSNTQCHDLRLSPDGKEFASILPFIVDDEWHLRKTFTYFYTPYKAEWGNDLHVLSENEIKKLPSGTGYISSDYSNEDEILRDQNWNEVHNEQGKKILVRQSARENNYLHIPAAFDDGEWMLFGLFEDEYGNYIYETIGKIHAEVFSNKPAVKYDNGKLNVSFNSDKTVFDDNIISISCYETDSQLWEKYFADDVKHYYLNERPLSGNGGKFTYETAAITKKNTFYRINTQSYNKNNNSTIGWVINENNDGWWDGWKNNGDTQEYDDFLQETTSYPVYVYLDDGSVTYNYSNKNFVDGAYGAMLLCEQPALVQFISCSKDLGSSIDEWELKGTVEDAKIITVTNGLELLSSNAINQKEGHFYYAVTVHFADGSENISRVYRK